MHLLVSLSCLTLYPCLSLSLSLCPYVPLCLIPSRTFLYPNFDACCYPMSFSTLELYLSWTLTPLSCPSCPEPRPNDSLSSLMTMVYASHASCSMTIHDHVMAVGGSTSELSRSTPRRRAASRRAAPLRIASTRSATFSLRHLATCTLAHELGE